MATVSGMPVRVFDSDTVLFEEPKTNTNKGGGPGGGDTAQDSEPPSGDGFADDVDNCPTVVNVDQNDADGDGIGDACDDCPDDTANDLDGDGYCDGTGYAGALSSGYVAEKLGDNDNCPDDPNPGQENTDPADATRWDVCDPTTDADGDGFFAEVSTRAERLR